MKEIKEYFVSEQIQNIINPLKTNNPKLTIRELAVKYSIQF
jgi:3-methyladenine DNA glycosylase AlkC